MSSASTLKDLVVSYTEYTVRVEYPLTDENTYEKCKSTTALLQSSIKQVKQGKDKLEKLYKEIREEYKTCKNKSDKKDIMLEIEQIENESQLHKELASADNLIYKLMARHEESKCVRDTMSVKLGYISQRALILQNAQSCSTAPQEDEADETEPIETADSNISQIPLDSVADNVIGSEARRCRSIKPPQATLPKFYGNVEDFSEFWAIFETLVHKSKELDVMEKILLLKESLRGKAQDSVKGIKLVPENYEWIIQTIQEKYCNHSVNRSHIAHKLISLKPANSYAESCSSAFDQIQILINQMVSAGYDVRRTCDPLWCEIILAKFPHDVVRPVLLSSHSQDSQTIGDLTAHLKKEIAAKAYLESRLGHRESSALSPSRDKCTMRRRYSATRQCLFCHRGNHNSMTCRTITDQARRRKILTDGRRCWKCCSTNHSSYECQIPDCSQCGKQHHSSLCTKGSRNFRSSPPRSWSIRQRSRRNSPVNSQKGGSSSISYEMTSVLGNNGMNNNSRKQQKMIARTLAIPRNQKSGVKPLTGRRSPSVYIKSSLLPHRCLQPSTSRFSPLLPLSSTLHKPYSSTSPTAFNDRQAVTHRQLSSRLQSPSSCHFYYQSRSTATK